MASAVPDPAGQRSAQAGLPDSLARGSGGPLLASLWHSPFPVTLQDADGRLVAVNDAYVAFAGRARAELIGRDPAELMPPEDRLPHLVERRIVDGAGHERWYRAADSSVTDAQGRSVRLSVLQDATAEHHAREQVDRSLSELEQWFALSPVGMLMFDGHGLLVRSNPAFEALVGRVPVALPDADPTLCALLGWADGRPDAALQPQAAAIERWGSLVDGQGRRRQLRARIRAIEPSPGHRRYLAVIEDRSAEDERDLAQLEIGALMNTAGVGVATFEPSRGWLPSGGPRGRAVQAGAPAGRGRGQAALQGISRELVEPASLPDYERLQRALKRGEAAEVRYAVRHPELGLRWLLTRVEPGQLGSGRTTTSVVTLDVTEQEQAQRRNEQLLRELTTILDGTSAGIAYLRGRVLVRCNQRFERMLGLPGGRAAGLTLAELFAGHERQPPMLHGLEEALAEGQAWETEIQLLHPLSRVSAWYALAVRRADAGDPGELVAVLNDISRLKQQQAELQTLLNERELMSSLSDVGIVWLRGDRIERANEAFSALSGHAPHELAALDHAALFEDQSAWQHYRLHDEPVLLAQGRHVLERRLRRKDGSLLWVQASLRRVDPHDADAGLVCSFVNVDERHRARKLLVRQADRTRAILDSVLVGIVTVGASGIEWMNRSARRMFGGELADFHGQPIAVVATADEDHPFRRTHYLHALLDGQAESFECLLCARDGREFLVVGNVVATGAEGAGGRQLTFALLDIERRREAEQRIARTQARLQRIIETAPLAIALHDAGTLRVLQHNQMAAAFDGLFTPDTASQVRADMAEALQRNEVTRREYRLRSGPDGAMRIWDARFVTIAATPDAEPEQLLLVASDVTEQRAAEEARFEAAIAQRDMLVKEVHHRIKNNLQGVAGLMQQVALRRPEVAPVISEAIGQVQAIAHVYGLQVGAGGPLRLRSVLESITGSVQRMFGRTIVFGTQGAAPEAWALPEAESIPLALTVNELLTNAVKHSTEGEVRCTLVAAPGQVCIEVVNRGRLPPGFELARVPGGVSGLGLVRALLPRRHATLRLQPGADADGLSVVATVVLVPPGVQWLG